MGYDAFVRCSCLKEGKTKSYPFDYQFHFNENGELELDMPVPGPDADDQPRRDYNEKYSAVTNWIKTCCEHPNMVLVSLRVANESGMSMLKWSLEQSGWEHFPTLKTELPIANGGMTPPEAAKRIMDELVVFLERGIMGRGALLVNSETNQVYQMYNAAREGVFRHHPAAEVDMGVDPEHGFFIAKRRQSVHPAVDLSQKNYRIHQPRQILFQAMRFEQRRARFDSVEYINQDDKSRYKCKPGNGGGANMFRGIRDSSLDLPEKVNRQRFHVEVRDYTHEDYRDIIQALIYLCNATAMTGNPIVWT